MSQPNQKRGRFDEDDQNRSIVNLANDTIGHGNELKELKLKITTLEVVKQPFFVLKSDSKFSHFQANVKMIKSKQKCAKMESQLRDNSMERVKKESIEVNYNKIEDNYWEFLMFS
jgi:hypothetical protein